MEHSVREASQRGEEVNLTLIESMAMATLKGDIVAARALADMLVNDYGGGNTPILPATRMTCRSGNVRAVVYLSKGVTIHGVIEGMQGRVEEWLRGDGPALTVHGVDRIELFELTDSAVVSITAEEVDEVFDRTIGRDSDNRNPSYGGVSNYQTIDGFPPPEEGFDPRHIESGG